MPTTPDFAWLFLKTVAGLILVLGLAIVLIRYVLPRVPFGRFGRRRAGWARVVDRFVLEPRKNLYLVKVAERYFLLGSGENSLSLLSELSKTEGEKIESQGG